MSEDAFSGIATPPPSLAAGPAEELFRARYGIRAVATPLVSERDLNYRMRAADGTRWVFKIVSAAESIDSTWLQVDALQHIERRDPALPVPRVVTTLTGEPVFEIDIDGQRHLARAVSWLAGRPPDARDQDAVFARRLGALLARLDAALSDFRHPGESRALLWDMQRAPELRRLLPHIADEAARAAVASALDDFAQSALPAFGRLPQQLIHSDAHAGNLLIDEDDRSLSGIIDFGDMVRLPRIVELAVAGAYLRTLDGDPLALTTALLEGYGAAAPLSPEELALLPCLICTRLAATVVILEWRRSLRRNDDAYLAEADQSEQSALPFLLRLQSMPGDAVLERIRG